MKRPGLVIGLWIAATLALAAAAAGAQSAYSLEDCFRAAWQRSEDAAIQHELISQAEAQYRQGVAAVLPTLGASAAYSRQDISGVRAGSSAAAESHELKLSGVQPLFRGFREVATLNYTRDLIAAQTELRRSVGLDLYAQTAEFYYSVLAAERDLEHIDADLGLLGQRLGDLRGRMRIGRSRPSEVLTVQTAEAELKAQREQVLGQALVAREALAFLTGLAPDIPLAVEPVAPLPETLDAYLARVESRPDVQAALRQAEAAREAVAIASGEHWPTLDLAGDYYIERSDTGQPGSWDALLSLKLPLFNGGGVSARVLERESEVRQAEQVLSRVRRTAIRRVRTLYAALRAVQAQAAAQEEARKLAEENYRSNLRDYNLSLVTNQEVLQALVAFQDIQRAADQARFAVLNDLRQLDAATAKPLTLIPEDRPR